MPLVDAPALAFFADLTVQVAAPQEVGVTPGGRRRVIAITGGEARGDGWRARVVPGGADFQLIVSETMAQLDARYLLETDAGDLVFVRNRAIRVAPAEITAKLVRGEPVDPSQVYFRCQPAFETAAPALAWINERLFVGAGVRRPDRVEMTFYALR